MKRIIALILALCFTASLAGCTEKASINNKEDSTKLKPYAITLASYPEMAPYPNEMEFFKIIAGVY